MRAKSCRDCSNFEERRDVDGVVLCAQLYGPFTCCEEFELKDKKLSVNKMYNRFCIACINFEEIGGVPVCARGHFPEATCESYVSRFNKLRTEQQDHLMKTAILACALNEKENNQYLPLLVEVARKIRW